MDRFSFALPSGYDWDVKKFAKDCQTKAWMKRHKAKLVNYADRLTSAGVDDKLVIKGMLMSAYGHNIGEQVYKLLPLDNPEKMNAMKWNIIKSQY